MRFVAKLAQVGQVWGMATAHLRKEPHEGDNGLLQAQESPQCLALSVDSRIKITEDAAGFINQTRHPVASIRFLEVFHKRFPAAISQYLETSLSNFQP